MRACFLGPHVCALGYGTATLQLPPLPPEKPDGKKADIVTIPAPKKRTRVSEPADTDRLAS